MNMTFIDTVAAEIALSTYHQCNIADHIMVPIND